MAELPQDMDNNNLCAAALRGDLAAMQQCLDNGADLNKCPKNGDSTLYHALSSGQIEPIEFLIKKGANMTWYDSSGISLFQNVLLGGRLDQVELFLKNGAIANSHPESVQLETNKNIIDFLIMRAADFNIPEINFPAVLLFAIMNNEEMAIEILMKNPLSEVNALHPLGFALLHIAAVHNRLTVVKHLVYLGADVNAMIKKSFKFTPLYGAVMKGNLEMVNFLLDHGASLKLFDRDCDFIPLHRAALTGRLDIVELLVNNGADVNEQDSQGRTALDWVCHPRKRYIEDSYENVFEDEYENGRDSEDEEEENTDPRDSSNNWTTEELQEDYKKIITFLLCHSADVNLQDNTGITALHAACRGRNFPFVQLLVMGKLQNETLCDENCKFFHPGCNKILRVSELLLPSNKLGKTNYFHLKASILLDNVEEAFLFLKGKPDVNIRNRANRTPLHVAVINGCDDVVEFLLKYQTDVNILDVNGYSPLQLALKYFVFYDDSRDLKSAKHLTEAIAIRETNGDAVNQEDFKFLNSVLLRDHYEECKTEIIKMKSKKIIDESFVSYYDFLSKDENKLAKLTNNNSIMLALKYGDYKKEFPIYGSLLERRIGLSELRQMILQISELIFETIVTKELKKMPKFIVQNILDYLTNEELLIFATYMVPRSTIFGCNIYTIKDINQRF